MSRFDNSDELAKLAKEIAMNLRPQHEVLNDWDITPEEYDEIEKIPFYQRALDQYCIEWNAVDSTAKRVQLKALHMEEETMPVLGRRLVNSQEPLSAVVEGHKHLTRMAGIGDPRQDSGHGAEKFVITFNLGADVERIEKMVTIKPEILTDQTETAHGKEMDPARRESQA